MPRSTTMPQYLQISELLIREILSGRLVVGERLAPERELAVEYNVAVGTLRKALADLTNKGFLERRQGSGNYVRQGDASAAIYSFFRLELKTGGGWPTADVLSVEKLEKPKDLPRFGTGEKGHRIRRLRKLDGQVIALEEIWLDERYKASIKAEELTDSLYQYYKEDLGLWIVKAEDQVSYAKMPDWGAQHLVPGQTCGFVERISWAQDGSTAEASWTWFDGNRARYVARLR